MKRILVLGGTRFFGKKLVELLIEAGHQVTILTRGQSGNPFGERVEHLVGDRLDKEELARLIEGRYFDIVYDNICYSPTEAYEFCEVFNGKIGKLVFTSSMSTYEIDGKGKAESDFDPYTYEIQMGSKEAFTYAEGKRQAEAVLFKYAQFPVVAVRFPIVLGVDDYTLRLHYHVEKVLKEEPIPFVNVDAHMSFILASEAARFLLWAGITEVEGPFNATANGTISLKDLIQLIEDVSGKEASIIIAGPTDERSPYAIPDTWYVKNAKAISYGFDFTNLHDWLKPLIKDIYTEMVSKGNDN